MIKEMKEDYDVEEKDAGVDVKCGLLRWSYFSRMQPESDFQRRESEMLHGPASC